MKGSGRRHMSRHAFRGEAWQGVGEDRAEQDGSADTPMVSLVAKSLEDARRNSGAERHPAVGGDRYDSRSHACTVAGGVENE